MMLQINSYCSWHFSFLCVVHRGVSYLLHFTYISQGVSQDFIPEATSLNFTYSFTGCFTWLYTCNISESHIFFHRVFHGMFHRIIPTLHYLSISHVFSQGSSQGEMVLLAVERFSPDVSHVSLNSILTWNSFQKFHITFHMLKLCWFPILKSFFTSQDFSQGVSHPKKVHMVFTWISHGFHRVTASSDFGQ